MKWIQSITLFAVLSAMTCPVLADDPNDISEFNQNLEEREWRALRDFLTSKRTINILEKARNLTISGEVGVDYRLTNEKLNGVRQRGGDAINAKTNFLVPRDKFDAEFTLSVDYVQDNAWAVAQVKFDNSAGYYNQVPAESAREMMGSGSESDLSLKKAYIGYNIYSDCGHRVDFEIGRRQFYHVFDSRIQFGSRFDGALLYHEADMGCYGTYFMNLAAFLVDFRSNHFGGAVETGVKDIAGTGFDFKTSYIRWRKDGRNAVNNKATFIGSNFGNIQFTGSYRIDPEYLCCIPAKLFGAVLWNTEAGKDIYWLNDAGASVGHYQNLGWYIGFLVGEVRGQGDWAFGGQYQWVEAQAVPDLDVSGIGHGNVNKTMLYTNGQGNGNYKGWRLDLLYALTDNFSIDMRYEASTPVRKNITSVAGVANTYYDFSYSQFKLEGIYAF